MSIPVKVVRDGQSLQAAEAITMEAGGSLALQAGDSVALNLTRAQVQAYLERGDDLVLQLTDGTTLTLADFFMSKDKPSHLFLVEDDHLVAVEFPAGHDDGALLASYAVADGATAAGFESLTAAAAGAAGTGGALGWALGGLAVVGGGLAASGGGGSSSSGPVSPPPAGNPDTQPPSPASELTVSADGTHLTGRAEAGATVGVDVNGDGTADVTAVVGADGTFEVALDPPLTNGETLSVVVTDAAGNRSESVQVVAGDTTAPAPATDLLIADDGSGISGTGEPGATVEVDLDGDGQPDLTAVIGEDGRFDIALEPPLINGEAISVVLTDPAGNSSDPVTVSGPDFPDPAQVNASNGSEIEGTAAPGSLVVITDGEGAAIGQASVGSDGQWSYTPDAPLPDGTVVQVVVQDDLGNQSPPTSVVVDGVAPAVPTLNPSNGSGFSGTAEPGAIITLLDGDGALIGEAIAGADGSWSVTPSMALPDGAQIIATASDAAGNTSDEVSITVDATAPLAPIFDASNGSVISGTAEPGSAVTLRDGTGAPIGEALTDADGYWSFAPATPLADGTLVVATVVDAAGNVSGEASVTVDGVAPEAPLINSTQGAVINGTTEAGSLVTLTDGGGNTLAQVVVDANGEWSHVFATPLDDGTVVNATATDAAGNVSGAASTTVDATAPAVPVVDASNGSELSGLAEAGALITITDADGALIGQTTVAGGGTWRVVPDTPLADGTVVNVVAVDEAGNRSGQASTVIDAVAPAAPIINLSNGASFSGTGEVGATITLFNESGVPIGQAIVEGDGTWTIVPDLPLPDGAVVTAVATDAASNSSAAATTTVDAIAPAAPTMEASNGTVISGTAEAGATILLTDSSSNPIGEVVADGNGDWSFTPGSALANGVVITAVAVDAAGNSSAGTSVTVDAVAPAQPVVNPSNGSVLTGTAESGALIRFSDDAANPLGEAVADSSGNWSFTPVTALAHGATVEVTATDAAGNTSGAVSVIIDAVPPAAPTVDPTNGVEITGTAEAGATITFTDGNSEHLGQTVADGSGNWSFTPSAPLADGVLVTVTASDASGNTSGAVTVTVDAVAPDAPVINPSNGSSISGTAEAGATILLTDGSSNPIGEVVADGNGDWSFTAGSPFADGTTVSVTATDTAGNTSAVATLTIDAVAPPAPVIAPSNGSLFSGTAEAGATVTLFDDGGAPIGEAIVDTSGIWSFTPGTALAHGTVVNATATDAAGNTSLAQIVTVDAVAPGAPVLDVSNGTVISGTAEANATITLTDAGNAQIGQAVADVNGNWIFTPGIALTHGMTVNATATDAAGNTSDQASMTIDAVAPGVPVVAPSNGGSIAGTAEAGATILLTDSSGNPLGQTTADGSGNWSFTPATAFAHGMTVNATATDAAGNTSGVGSVVVDAVAPAAPGIDPSNGSVVSGTAEAGSIVTLTDGAGSPLAQVTVDGSGNWIYSPVTGLPHGTVVNATATDAAGNESGNSSVIVDAVAPSAPVVAPSNGSAISGTAEAGTTLTFMDVDGNPVGEAVADGSGAWSFTPTSPLPHGTLLEVTATDAAGNTSTASSVVIDAVAPAAPVLDPSNGSGVAGNAEAGAIIRLTDSGGLLLGEVTADGNGDWAFSPGVPFSDGTTINATATDAAGNTSGVATLTVDAIAPSAPTMVPSNGTVFTGTAEAGATVTLVDGGGAPIGEAIADATGNWSFTPATALAHGTVVTATATDAASNTGVGYSITVDAVAPGAPVLDVSNGTVISGTAEANATITLTDAGNAQIGQVVADVNGNWIFTPTTALADGVVVHATATDAAGNTSGSATTTVDASAPAAPIINPSNGELLSGTAEAGTTITLMDVNGSVLGQAQVDGSGDWSFVPGTVLADGTLVRAVATDAAMNDSTEATITIDGVAPAPPTISISADGATVTGTAEPGSEVQLVIDGDMANPISVNVDGSGNFTHTLVSPLIASELITAVSVDAAGNTSPSVQVNAPDLQPPVFTLPEAADSWINLAEASDGIEVNVALRPTMSEGQVVTVHFTGQGGYEIEASHVLTAADILAGTATVTLAPSGAQGPLPQGTANITAAMQGGPDATAQSFTVDTVAPDTPVLSLLASVLGISAEPGTELTVTLTAGGVTANTTVFADNGGLASVNLLSGLSAEFTWDQLLNAQVDVTGHDPAGNASTVASLVVGLGLLAPVTLQDMRAASSLGATGLEFALSGVTEPDSAVIVQLVGPGLDVTLDPVAADATGDFALDLFSAASLAQLGLTADDLVTMGDQLSLVVHAVNPDAVASADYHLTLGQSGLYVTTAGIQVNGGIGDEVLSGLAAEPDNILGGDGSDLILNIGTGDRAYGGDGNDTIQVTSPDFVLVDGGAGFDTVLLANGTDIDYGMVGVGTFTNIERIDLGTGDAGSALTLTEADLDAITDGNNVLQITGDSNDSLTIMGGTDTLTTQTIDGISYDVFTVGSFTILVEENTVVVYG